MAKHSLYPGFIRMFYTANAHQHRAVWPVVPALSGGVWTVAKVLGGTYDPWTDAVDAAVLLAKVFFKTTSTFDTAELYSLASPTASPVFRATYNIGVSGTSTDPIVPWSQGVFTFRLDVGGLLRNYFMESIFATNLDIPYAALPSPEKAWADFVMSGDGFIFGRDEGVPLANTGLVTKINDRLRKKFLLNA